LIGAYGPQFSTSELFSREAIFFLCQYHLLRQQDVAKWMPTKEKGRFARKNSLVENRLIFLMRANVWMSLHASTIFVCSKLLASFWEPLYILSIVACQSKI
jgi:hypothetical protein